MYVVLQRMSQTNASIVLERDQVRRVTLTVVVDYKDGRIRHIVDRCVVEFKRIPWLGIGYQLLVLSLVPITDHDLTDEHVLNAVLIFRRVCLVARICRVTCKVHALSIANSVASGEGTIESLLFNLADNVGMRSMKELAFHVAVVVHTMMLVFSVLLFDALLLDRVRLPKGEILNTLDLGDHDFAFLAVKSFGKC